MNLQFPYVKATEKLVRVTNTHIRESPRDVCFVDSKISLLDTSVLDYELWKMFLLD